MRERWFSKRAVSLHAAVLVFVPGCAVAAWWQVTRAADGNQLSYLYMVMWPVFGLLGIFFWWLLVHTDYETVGLKGMRNSQTPPHGGAAASFPLAPAAAASPVADDADHSASLVANDSVPVDAASLVAPDDAAALVADDVAAALAAADMDPDLAAYNERLADLAKEGPKTWRRPERIVARRTQ